jgi:hypothetical protein
MEGCKNVNRIVLRRLARTAPQVRLRRPLAVWDENGLPIMGRQLAFRTLREETELR